MNKIEKNPNEKDKIMIGPKEKPTVKLIDTNGNSFAIIGRVKKALLDAGADKEYVLKYQNEVMSGDYNNLLCVTMDYVHVT
jgi:hypothetical protein